MEIELIEIHDFLAEHPPFDQLPGDVLVRLSQLLSIRYCRRGMPFPPQDIRGHYAYILRKGALEFRSSDGTLLEKLGEGDLYTLGCEQASGIHHIHTVEDTLFYLLPCVEFNQLRQRHEFFDAYFSSSRHERLQQAVDEIKPTQLGGKDLLISPVKELIRQQPVCTSPATSIQDAARLMTEHRATAILVMDDGQICGLLTDSDLRKRCISEGLPYTTPVSKIMSTALRALSPTDTGLDALLTMARHNINHLPVIDGDKMLGMLSSNDLLRYERVNAIELVEDINKSESFAALYTLAPRLPELQLHLLNAGADANQTGQALSTVADALTRHLIKLTIEQIGPAPIPFVWLAAGSHARRELSIHADQDNALLLDDRYQREHGAYFEALAQQVTEGLKHFGFIYCPGEVMARNPKWRQPLHIWQDYFEQWITNPDKKALMLANNFFDMRPVYGDKSLFTRLHEEVISKAERNRIFLAHMASNALQNQPPIGFFRNFVLIHDGEHDNTFNLKLSGLIPIIDLARVYALSSGVGAINTHQRLMESAGTRSLSKSGADDLIEAWQLIATLRMRHQNNQFQQGLDVDNFVSPEELTPLEKTHLKEAFSVIRTMQLALEQRFQASRIV